MLPLLMAGAAGTGGAFVYFLDPDQGRRRRGLARDRFRAAAHWTAERVAQASRAAGTRAAGYTRRVAHPRAAQATPPNDAALAAKVETELFRDPSVPKGTINVNAERGV